MKAGLKRELLLALEASLATLRAAHADALAGATHAEARPENEKDTRALEQSYLARGQATRVEALEVGVAAVKALATAPARGAATAGLGSLVEAEEDGVARRYYLAPEGGGLALSGGVQVVTPRSPLGQALLGRRAGEAVEVTLAGRSRQLELTRVR